VATWFKVATFEQGGGGRTAHADDAAAGSVWGQLA